MELVRKKERGGKTGAKGINKAMDLLSTINGNKYPKPIPFARFLELLAERPKVLMRNVFQVFHDMIKHYIDTKEDEYPDDPESIGYVDHDCSRLFVDGVDNPFFADRIFAHRLVNMVDALKQGVQQNKVYVFEGSHGSGKSTCLANLLRKFEEYARSDEGLRYEVIWRINCHAFKGAGKEKKNNRELFEMLRKIIRLSDGNLLNEEAEFLDLSYENSGADRDIIEIPCPSHDNPILVIPKNYRYEFFDNLFSDDNEFKARLFEDKEYSWVFKKDACTICCSLYEALVKKLRDPLKVFWMLYAQPYKINRRLGEGISVFNPGDKPDKQNILGNPVLQKRINAFLRDSNKVKYNFSCFAETNEGIYALMDVKSYNIERFKELHNLISDGIHKIGNIEENINSLFLTLINPEDKKHIKGLQSFADRIEYINIPYVLDINTELQIYRNVFGKKIHSRFLPHVLTNFARVIISTRLDPKSKALFEWIGNPLKYKIYCDKNLLLLKMAIYSGRIPEWLTEEDRKRFTAKRRRRIINEAEKEGIEGFSGRDSIKIFNEFYRIAVAFARRKKLKSINMSHLMYFFTKRRRDLNKKIPEGFLDSLLEMYNYTVLQEVKESLYYYNEKQISDDIQNYLFGINFDLGATVVCTYTEKKITITEKFLKAIENRFADWPEENESILRDETRRYIQKEYSSHTLTQEMGVQGKTITQTELYKSIYEKYVRKLKEKVLEPFLKNENFRRAIKDYDEKSFKTYDQEIKKKVRLMIGNLCRKYGYNPQEAKEVCVYVIDHNLTIKFK